VSVCSVTRQELAVELPAREARRDELSREQNHREMRVAGYKRRDSETMFEKRVNPNRTDGQGGFFVPPLWLVDEYIDLPRFGRTTANLCRTMGLPSGTDSINLPKVATGTATGVQTADAGAVTSTDLTDTSVSAPVRTIAGQQDIAIQLLDQSPVSFDEVVFADLIADYNLQPRHAGDQRLGCGRPGDRHPRDGRHQRGDLHRRDARRCRSCGCRCCSRPRRSRRTGRCPPRASC
jgi:hypothetical protein